MGKDKKEKVVDPNKVKLSEKLSVKLRRTYLVNGTITCLIVAIIVAAYIAINIGITQLNLPEIDVTENKIYSVSEASKKAIEKVNKEVTFYVYGVEEDNALIGLLKKYNKVNNNIKYELINEKTNYDMVQEYTLESGYMIAIVKCGESKKVIDLSTELTTYDYNDYSTIDITEQVFTNTILTMSEDVKPKVYFLSGHSEFSIKDNMILLGTYLANESFEVEELNLMGSDRVPDDCNVLAIMGIRSDLMESEVDMIQNYINNGGNLYIGVDVLSAEDGVLPNFQKILNNYNVRVDNGYIVERDPDYAVKGAEYIFRPQVSGYNKITADISSDSFMYLVYSAKLGFGSQEELESNNVTKETLLTSSENSSFVTDFSSNMEASLLSLPVEQYDIGALMTKKMTVEDKEVESKLVIVSTCSFATDYTIDQLSTTYPVSYIGSNKDFVINSMAYLGEKENTLTIRKDMGGATGYTATDKQKRIVNTICFSVPLIIIVSGIIISNYRKKRK